MIQEWRTFLIERGAVFAGDQLQHFGHPQAELAAAAHGGALMTDLSSQGLIAVNGEEAGTFLQNILTNDVREINERHSQLTGLCNPKGRLLTLFRLFQRDTSFYLSCPRSQLADILKRLNMYVLRSKVKLTDASDRFCRIGLASLQASHGLKSLVEHIPEAVNEVCRGSNYSVMRIPGEPPRYEVAGELNSIKKLWDELSKTVMPAGVNLWELLNIRAGIATLYPGTQETFIPQQVNLELTEGVSFTKGCYPGQEIIARMHYRGKPSRRMFLIHIVTDKPPQPGEFLYLANSEQEQPIGEVVDARLASEGGYDSLAVLQLGSIAKGDITLGNRAGSAITLGTLPYSVPA